MKYDNTDIHLRYDEARKISKDRMTLWLKIISKYVSGRSARVIADLGCGTGRFLKALAKHFSARVYGLDPSRKMLTVAQRTHDSAVIIIQGTSEYIPLGNGSIDLVFLSQTYHHIQSKRRALSEIMRILKPGGSLCIRNSTKECLDTYIHLRFFPKVLKSDHKVLPSRNEVMDLLDDIGFISKVHDIVRQKFAENAKEYLRKIKTKTDSDLARLSSKEFWEGFAKLETYFEIHDLREPVFEEIDLFVCAKPG